MKILIAPDSFKGSLTAAEAAELIAEAARVNFPQAEICKIPIADGGEGTLEALMESLPLIKAPVRITGPDYSVKDTFYVRMGNTAYIEMAKTSGLCMTERPSAAKSTSKGLGEAIMHALTYGARNIYLTIGGSATNDGGTGMMQALGVRFLDADGTMLEGTGENLGKIESIDLSGLSKTVKDASWHVICDVQNPLLGKTGATRVYGKQKGATEAELDMLENGMQNYASVLEKTFGKRFDLYPGAGAAGGVGAALFAFLHATFCPGIETVLDIIGFDRLAEDADLIITGEGKMDGQSAYGKAPVGVAKRCGGKPVVAIVGGIGDGYEEVYEKGIRAVFSIFHTAMPLAQAMENAAPMMQDAADRMFRMIKVGMQIR